MSLVRVDQLLKMAQDNNTAIIAFICIDYNMVKSVIRAAEINQKPAIVMLLPEHVTKNQAPDMHSFVAMTKHLALNSEAVIALHLDHSFEERQINEAIQAGFTSVMFDASKEDLDTNIRRVREVVAYAHSKNVVVEAELGAIGLAKDMVSQRVDYYTDPEAVAYFVQETQVDSLAIAIGNAHGDYPMPPKLDFERLNEIQQVTRIPLVLHGGSGLPDDQLEKAFSHGIRKFNYGTDVLNCYDDAIRRYHNMHQPPQSLDLLGIPEFVQNQMIKLIGKKMELCKILSE